MAQDIGMGAGSAARAITRRGGRKGGPMCPPFCINGQTRRSAPTNGLRDTGPEPADPPSCSIVQLRVPVCWNSKFQHAATPSSSIVQLRVPAGCNTQFQYAATLSSSMLQHSVPACCNSGFQHSATPSPSMVRDCFTAWPEISPGGGHGIMAGAITRRGGARLRETLNQAARGKHS